MDTGVRAGEQPGLGPRSASWSSRGSLPPGRPPEPARGSLPEPVGAGREEGSLAPCASHRGSGWQSGWGCVRVPCPPPPRVGSGPWLSLPLSHFRGRTLSDRQVVSA